MLRIPQNVYVRYGLVATGVTSFLGTAFYFLRAYIPKRFGGLREDKLISNGE